MPDAVLPRPVPDTERAERLAELGRAAREGSGWTRWLWSRNLAPGMDYDLGTALLTLGSATAAEEPLLRAVLASPHAFAPAFNLGVAYQKLDRPRAARVAFRIALAADPDHPDIAPLRAPLDRR